MVATRIVSDKFSVGTPNRTANSRRGWILSSGRLSAAPETTFATIGKSSHLTGELGRHIRDRGIVLPGHEHTDISQSVIVEKPVANIRNAPTGPA